MTISEILAGMGTSGIPLLAAVSLGFLMAISPCTLATSIAGILFIAKNAADHRRVVLSALLYTFGRMTAYGGLAFLIVWFSLTSRDIAVFLQNYGQRLLAPVLILAGLWMLGFVPLHRVHRPHLLRLKDSLSAVLGSRGGAGSFMLGAFFAFSFCPINVVIYFGMLIPLAYQNSDPILIPAIFTIASTLPVLLASGLLMASARGLGKTMITLQDLNLWMQRLTGIVFLIAGVYYLSRFLGM